ncbi:MAG: hypothetical protein WDZ82_03880 [Candidatus Paceibacterota bacterium]
MTVREMKVRARRRQRRVLRQRLIREVERNDGDCVSETELRKRENGGNLPVDNLDELIDAGDEVLREESRQDAEILRLSVEAHVI